MTYLFSRMWCVPPITGFDLRQLNRAILLILQLDLYTSLNPPPLGGPKRGLGGDIGQLWRNFGAS